MRRAGGYAVIVSPDGPPVERDTFTCNHCQHVVFVKPKADPSDLGGFCRRCMKLICPGCNKAGGCTPFEEQLRRMEASDISRRSMGL